MPEMASKPKALLFDLDGTLLDTARDLGNALNHVLATHHQPPCDYAIYRNIASDGSKGLLNIGFGSRIHDYNFAQLRQQFLDYYHQAICVETALFCGVGELIQGMDSANIPWGIVTNKPGWLTAKLLPNFSEFENCQVVISGDTFTQRKPHPRPLLAAAKSLNVVPENTWYVGDAKRDIDAAKAANMLSVLASYGYIDTTHQAHLWAADLQVDHPATLLDYI
ncbi:MAG: 2-phosphoglycolate phosphatase [Paraglaciecola sp.]|jgi:2-phosphoglycolate phosphatase